MIRAHGKLNLSLEVVGRRADGYYDLVSVVQEISLADALTFVPDSGLRLDATHPDLAGERNLALSAARLLALAGRQVAGASIHLDKQIPVAAGLGGGSSDAAATLVAANRLWRQGVPARRLLTMAAQLGSDVPFFLYGGTCLVEGRGERVLPLPTPACRWYALSNPGIAVPTGDIFGALRGPWTDGGRTRDVADAVSAEGRVTVGVNALQATLFALYPAAERCLADQSALAPGPTLVSGSGATVYSLCGSAAEAARIAAGMRENGYWADVAHSVASRGWENPCRPAP